MDVFVTWIIYIGVVFLLSFAACGFFHWVYRGEERDD